MYLWCMCVCVRVRRGAVVGEAVYSCRVSYLLSCNYVWSCITYRLGVVRCYVVISMYYFLLFIVVKVGVLGLGWGLGLGSGLGVGVKF